MRKSVMIIVCVVLSGCANKQYLRLVSMDVYDGLHQIQESSDQVYTEATKRYDSLYRYSTGRLAADMTVDQDSKDLTLKTMEHQREQFRAAVAENLEIKKNAENALYALGWEEGPSDPMPTIGAFVIGAGAGAAAVAAF